MPLKKFNLHPSEGVQLSAATCAQTVDLATAIASLDTQKVKRILEENAGDSDLVNCVLGPLGVTPLHLACAKLRSESITSLLIQEGAKVTSRDKIGRTALHYAAALGNEKVVQCLVTNGANVNCYFEVCSSACPSPRGDNGERLAKDLIPEYEKLPLPECWGRTPLHQAVKSGHVACVEILLQNGANVNAEDEKGLTPLLLAGAGGLSRYEAIVDLLVFRGADVNKVNPDINSSPLYHAVALGSVKATQLLLNAGASLDYTPLTTPRHFTLSARHVMSSRVETVLHVAASVGCLEVTGLLLQFGAKKFVNCCNNVGCTPLHKAAYAGSRDCLRLLIDNDGDISICSDSGMTVVDIIMSYVPRPINFLTDCLSSRITANASSINDRDFKVELNFNILSPIGCTYQMSVVSSLAVTSKLLQHPLVEAFVLAKWAKLRFFFLVIAFIHFSFVISLSTYITFWIHTNEQVEWSRVVLMISSFPLLVHSATELVFMGKQRLQQFETWLTLFNTSLSLMITLLGDSGVVREYEGVVQYEIPCWIRHVASVVILLSWCGLMLLIGRFPTWGYYALMFSVVLQNVMKVFLTFICLVIGFALSFSVQFPHDNQFNNPWHALVRTTVMMTGEYDYMDLFSKSSNVNGNSYDDSESETLVPTSRIIFMLFVLLASVALMNLMVGLAVSDIQGLQTEGNIRRLQKQSEFVAHLERLLAHRLFVKYLEWWVPRCISRHRIPNSISIQPSIITNYEILSTPLLEAVIKLALQNRSKYPTKQSGSPLNYGLSMYKMKKMSDPGPKTINEKPLLLVPREISATLGDIVELKQLLLETLTALNSHQHQQAEDVADSNRPTEDSAISVNAMLRRVSTPHHSVVHQVFSH
ncbi:transient receptor potential channel pyrexia-like [Homalodisca vitripennis]|nr:transient receptor potential channel pyrexia-like [Homalodisca vitripennis]